MTVPDLGGENDSRSLLPTLGAAANVLSAIGVHWSGAKHARDMLSELTARYCGNVPTGGLGSFDNRARNTESTQGGHTWEGLGTQRVPTTNTDQFRSDQSDVVFQENYASTQSQHPHGFSFPSIFEGSFGGGTPVDLFSNDFDISSLFTGVLDSSSNTANSMFTDWGL